jgi:hypothetical protein
MEREGTNNKLPKCIVFETERSRCSFSWAENDDVGVIPVGWLLTKISAHIQI